MKKNHCFKEFKINEFLINYKKSKIFHNIITIIKVIIILILLLIVSKSMNINDNKIKISLRGFNQYKNFLPYLNLDSNSFPLNKEELFNAKQLYISDVRITPEYIRFIRPINESEEQIYKSNSYRHEKFIDDYLFKKRIDQYDYQEFCKIALNEKLIEELKNESYNK